jgi:excisionase family DNA binding protein
MSTTGNMGLDALADAIAARVIARIDEGEKARLLTVNEAAHHIGRSPKAVRHLIANGDIPAVRHCGRVHVDRADLNCWIEMHKGR